jgi:signal transduction histidine kinase
METGHPIQEEHRVIQQRLGTKRVIALSAAALIQAEDVPYGAVLLFRDVTQQEELYRLQHEFVAAISHELRAPLAKISMVINMLQQAGAPLDTSLEILKAQNQQLTSFADKILQISHLEVGKAAVSPHPLPISRVVEEVITAWRETEPSRRLTLHLPTERPWVWGDERVTRLVLNELMDNAFKYTPAETSITVTVQAYPPAHILIAVQDEGPGIAPQHQVKVFDQFYRVDGSDAQAVYGHGLGLYIAKRYIEMMEGEIWLESDKGQGCRFAFTLPLMEEDYERAVAHH